MTAGVPSRMARVWAEAERAVEALWAQPLVLQQRDLELLGAHVLGARAHALERAALEGPAQEGHQLRVGANIGGDCGLDKCRNCGSGRCAA